MSYLPEEKAYLFVIKDNETPVFPSGAEKIESYTVPIGEGLVQVIGVPKSLNLKLSSVKLKSLDLAKKVKDKNFALIVSKYNDQEDLLVLVKNSAVWLTKVVPVFEKDEAISQIKDYVLANYNVHLGRVLIETQLASQRGFMIPQIPVKYIVYTASFVAVVIIGLALSYLIDQYF